jgi:hypothetical protein
MDNSTVSDDDIRAARESWLLVRPLAEREGPEYAFYLNLVQEQSRRLAASFRADRAAGHDRTTGQPDGASPG